MQEMFDLKKLPEVLIDLLTAQNEHNSAAYANSFADDATVYDEGHNYNGKSEIKGWNETTNEKYQTKLDPIGISKTGNESILTVMVSGVFDGSPLPLKYHFVIEENKIVSLRVTG
jgi:ketosteroid isomerase-like protein